MNQIRILSLEIAMSIYAIPCTEEELLRRKFLKSYSKEGVQRLIMHLEKDAIYYRGDKMYVYKKWAGENLTGA